MFDLKFSNGKFEKPKDRITDESFEHYGYIPVRIITSRDDAAPREVLANKACDFISEQTGIDVCQDLSDCPDLGSGGYDNAFFNGEESVYDKCTILIRKK